MLINPFSFFKAKRTTWMPEYSYGKCNCLEYEGLILFSKKLFHFFEEIHQLAHSKLLRIFL